MTTKQYKICRLAIMIILTISIITSINIGNYYLPIIFLLSSLAGMYFCHKAHNPKKALVDERDYQVAGNAARYTIIIYGFLGAIGTFVLMGISQKEGVLYAISQYLAFSVCFIMLLNVFLFRYLIKRQNEK
ncbi:hypothetical protein C0583_06255 [Candidatus Parcubacteria bacterium]|nr:MAG: hypothetical protein C0583_06255 [Candidatus Parcubacteria bacterium]